MESTMMTSDTSDVSDHETTNAGKHPEFDDCWHKHSALVWWTAHRMAGACGGPPSRFIGTLTLLLNRCLWHHNSNRSKFSTYFVASAFRTCKEWDAQESERKALNWFKHRSTNADVQKTQVNYAYHEANYILYRVPEQDSLELMAMLEAFNTLEEAWRFFVRELTAKQRFCVEARFKDGRSLRNIADQLKVSHQDVDCCIAGGLKKIGKKLKLIRAFTELFEERIGDD